MPLLVRHQLVPTVEAVRPVTAATRLPAMKVLGTVLMFLHVALEVGSTGEVAVAAGVSAGYWSIGGWG